MIDFDTFMAMAIKEDVGDGDHSTLSSIEKDAMGTGRLLVKETGILAGVSEAERIFKAYDENLEIETLISDGEHIAPGKIAFYVKGSARSLLTIERLVLNIMQRMSGIATKTRKLVDMVNHTKVTLLDTRKTTPLFRYFEKQAVLIGGAKNHRFGLYDRIMLKDNHIDYAGGVESAIRKAHAYLENKNLNIKIEVEVRNFDELEEALSVGGVDVIMLDNFNPTDITKALPMIKGKCKVEASGGIRESNLVEYAETGVDFISIGALTHQIDSLDLSLKATIEKQS